MVVFSNWEEHQLAGLILRRSDTGLSLIPAVSASVCSEYSVVMRGEERDAEATLVHATYIQYSILFAEEERGEKTLALHSG